MRACFSSGCPPIYFLTFHFSPVTEWGFFSFQTQPPPQPAPCRWACPYSWTGHGVPVSRLHAKPSRPLCSAGVWRRPGPGSPETGVLATQPGLSPLSSTPLLTFPRETAEPRRGRGRGGGDSSFPPAPSSPVDCTGVPRRPPVLLCFAVEFFVSVVPVGVSEPGSVSWAGASPQRV